MLLSRRNRFNLFNYSRDILSAEDAPARWEQFRLLRQRQAEAAALEQQPIDKLERDRAGLRHTLRLAEELLTPARHLTLPWKSGKTFEELRRIFPTMPEDELRRLIGSEPVTFGALLKEIRGAIKYLEDHVGKIQDF